MTRARQEPPLDGGPPAPPVPVASGGDPYGSHRALDPRGSLPQAAWRLDADFTRLFEGETLVGVETLNIDAASFAQMEEAARGGGGEETEVDAHVAQSVSE